MLKKFIVTGLSAILSAAISLQQPVLAIESISPASGGLNQQVSRQELLVQFRGTSIHQLPGRILSLRKKAIEIYGSEYGEGGAGLHAAYDGSFARIQVPPGVDPAVFSKRLLATGDVRAVEPNAPIYPLMVPNDVYYEKYQWNLELVHAAGAWDYGTGSGVTVAVLDSGIAYETVGQFAKAPDFGSTKFTEGYDFINRDTHANDDNGHGTHIAGILAASINDRYGIAGAASGVTVMPVKVLDKNGNGTVADLAEAVRWAADHGAKIINMSVGTSEHTEVLTQALSYAYGKGVILIAAVGNDGTQKLLYPAAESDYVIAVGASESTGQRAKYSNTADTLDIIAPGGLLETDQNGDGQPDGVLSFTLERFGSYVATKRFIYTFSQGTSVAAPHVSAAAALIVAQGVTEPAAVRAILRNSADDKGVPGRDTETGSGLLNIEKAVKMAKEAGSNGNSATAGTAQIVRTGEVNETQGSQQPPTVDTGTSESGQSAAATPPAPLVESLHTRVQLLNRLGREVTRFTWWDTITVRVTVYDQSDASVANAAIEMRYRYAGGSDLGSLTSTANDNGVATFIIGPFRSRSTVDMGVIASYNGIYSALVTKTASMR